uniref:NADH dehydrogenase subunit 6 n=1 Tax=Wellcomia siamensis TaxID=435744 RepID=G4V255_WELSI|nr:NADH dehydrogenase subunit 6 [Wellcomia siamensis]ACV96772.1 NADH dehydrogenase subunit 6 [Wellcomia siamensis]
MLVYFMFFSVLMCVFFYFNLDPMKCSFFLVLSLFFILPVISFGIYVWYSYYICMIFLSGIFVILVYFSSLSNYVYFNKSFVMVFFFFSFFVGDIIFNNFNYLLNINIIYYVIYFFVFVYIIFLLLFFLGFMSYYLSFGSAMRSL